MGTPDFSQKPTFAVYIYVYVCVWCVKPDASVARLNDHRTNCSFLIDIYGVPALPAGRREQHLQVHTQVQTAMTPKDSVQFMQICGNCARALTMCQGQQDGLIKCGFVF